MAFTSSKLPGRPSFPPTNVTHIWPKDDTFDNGGLASPLFFSSWIPVHGFPATKTFGTGGGGVTAASVLTRESKQLSDAYSPSPTTRLATVTIGDWSANGGDTGMFLRRDVISNATDGAVEGAFQVVSFVGTSANSVPANIFVCARVSGMAANSAVKSWGTDYFLDATATPISGYFFGSASNAPNGSRFFLVRINAGTVTTLGEANFGGAGDYNAVFGDKTLPHYYRMQFSDAGGGNLGITCTVGNATLLAEGGVQIATIFSVTDTTPLTTAGRSGFLMQSEVNVAGVAEYAIGSPYQRIDEGGVALVADVWTRRQPRDTLDAQAASHTATPGFDLRSGWCGDAFGSMNFGSGAVPPWVEDGATAGAPIADRFFQVASTNAIGSSAAQSWREGYTMSQRKATSAISQHRRIRVNFSSTGTAPTGSERRWAGVCLRAGGGVTNGLSPKGGYLFQASTDDGGTFGSVRFELWRVALNGGSATLVAELASGTIATGTDYTVAFQAFNIPDSGGNPEGIVVLKGFLDGTQVVLGITAAGTTAGLTADAAGNVFDNTTEAYTSNEGEGIRVAGFTGSRATFVDEWTELTLAGEIGTDENDQASIAVLSEVSNDTGQTLTLPPAWIAEEIIRTEIDTFEFERGHVRRGLRFADQRRRWRVRATAITTAERDALLTFWDGQDGVEKSFSWAPPNESALKVHFADDALDQVLRAPGVWSVEFDLEELRS